MITFVTYRGTRMVAEWPAQIRQAQTERQALIDGHRYPRIPYGMEDWWDETNPPPTKPCRDCGVLPGEYHVKNCCLERCPACRECQRLLCETGHESDSNIC